MVILVTTTISAACNRPKRATRDVPISMKALVLLTREGCVNTPTMRARLDDALTALHLPREYDVINSDSLPRSDIRRGYPTPTLLHQGVDVFGLPTPSSPPSDPT